MASKRDRDFDSGGGGTLSVDVSKLDLDDEPPRRRGGRGGGGGGRGRRGGADDFDSPRGGGRDRKRGGASLGHAGGTMMLDVGSGRDFDDPPPKARDRGSGGGGGRRGRGAALVDDEPPRSSSRGRRGRDRTLAGGRRATEESGGDGQVVAGFHDWDQASGRGASGEGGASGHDDPLAVLVVQEPNKDERTHPITLKHRSLTVGREIGNDVVLSDIKASRQHFEISYLGGKFTLKDLGSGNGTKVNGNKVTRHELANGDSIILGGCHLLFAIDEDALARALDRDHLVSHRDPDSDEAEETDGAGEDEEETPTVLSPVAVLLVAMMLLGTLGFTALLVVWLVFKPEPPKPVGAKIVELETIPQEDPSVRQAVSGTARGLVAVAEQHNRADKLWHARRVLQTALLLDPGLAEAQALSGRIDSALVSRDTPACKVSVDPENPRRNREMSVRVVLNEGVQKVAGTFGGEVLDFRAQTGVPGEWLAQLKLPRSVGRGPQSLNIMVIDLMDAPVELSREVVVR